ncbi:hypothetical protein B4109_3233 [Geobacillus stearothermophilus]|uniref:Uncharacterized protein n=1 Tax=Geobacillus stearothermophilus TaxID=1422 RepID=A0A150M944_GEOSE|nr:hypothetical protein B4109_3233 [Geobacillus stearothermophilus]
MRKWYVIVRVETSPDGEKLVIVETTESKPKKVDFAIFAEK